MNQLRNQLNYPGSYNRPQKKTDLFRLVFSTGADQVVHLRQTLIE